MKISEIHSGNKKTIDSFEEYSFERQNICKSYLKLLDKIPSNLQDEFCQLLDMLPMQLEQHFIDGFYEGVKYSLENFSDDFPYDNYH